MKNVLQDTGEETDLLVHLKACEGTHPVECSYTSYNKIYLCSFKMSQCFNIPIITIVDVLD